MTIYGLHIVDFILIIVYLLGITAIGLAAYTRIKSASDYFMGGRSFGTWFMVFFSFGAGTHTDQAVGVASKTYTNGLSGIWYQWLWLFLTPFYWLIAPLLRRIRALTMAQFFEVRYGVSLAMFYAIVAFLNNAVTIGTMLRGAGEIIGAVTDNQVPLGVSVAIMTILFVSYGVAGGLVAAIITDLIQGILTVVLSFILLPFALSKVGGLTGLHEKITDPHMFSLVAPGEITVFFITMMVVNGLFSIMAQPHVIQLCGAGRTEWEGRMGFTYGNFLKRFCTVAWCLTGLCAVVLYPNLGTEGNPSPDQAFGMIARDLLPVIAPGLLGIFIASMLAAVMSSCDAMMNASAGLLTMNVYKPLFARKKAMNEVLVGRCASILLVSLGIFIAFWLEDVIHGIEIMWKITGMLGISIWMGIYWRRATPAGAWTAALSASAVLLLTQNTSFVEWLSAAAPMFVDASGEAPKMILPWQMLAYLSTGIVCGIVVSLFTKQRDPEKLRDLFECIRTPVQDGEEIEDACILPDVAKDKTVPKLFDSPNWEIPKFDKTDIVGFLIAAVCVLAIVLSVVFIARWGA